MVSYYNPETRPLTMEEMTVNGNYIMAYLLAKGWTKNAICGMLGNMQSESSINPARWQSDRIGWMSGGVGLVQWTPATKYLDWASSKGYNWRTMESNLERILYEVANGLQWYATSDYPLSFDEFIVSTETPEYLAQAFIRNYERPADQTQPARSTQARYWWDHLDGSGVIIGDPGTGGDPTTPETNNEIYHLWLSNAMRW
jgi:hypothetical protein